VGIPSALPERQSQFATDCGGIPGYDNLLNALADPRHPEHEELGQWIGGRFDPEAFSIDKVDRLLSPARRRSKTSAH